MATIAHFLLPMFVLVLAAGTATLNTLPLVTTVFEVSSKYAIIMPVYAQPDLSSTDEIQQMAEDLLSNITELQNQAFTNESYLGNEDNTTTTFSNEADLAMQQLKTDVSGIYQNPTYGILDFTIPQRWYGSERQWSGDKSITLDMHEGTNEEYMKQLTTLHRLRAIIQMI
jgi:hypothetical protein